MKNSLRRSIWRNAELLFFYFYFQRWKIHWHIFCIFWIKYLGYGITMNKLNTAVCLTFNLNYFGLISCWKDCSAYWLFLLFYSLSIDCDIFSQFLWSDPVSVVSNSHWVLTEIMEAKILPTTVFITMFSLLLNSWYLFSIALFTMRLSNFEKSVMYIWDSNLGLLGSVIQILKSECWHCFTTSHYSGLTFAVSLKFIYYVSVVGISTSANKTNFSV